jgi:hypothetical protein
VVGRHGGHDNQVEVRRIELSVLASPPRGLDGHGAGRFVRRRHAALQDAGALDDPLVAGVDQLFQVGVAEHALGHVRTGAGDGRAQLRRRAGLDANTGRRADDQLGLWQVVQQGGES